MDYGEVLSRAWQIISKHKILWLFGILASCGSGRVGGSGSSEQSGSNYFDFADPDSSSFGEFPEFFSALPDGFLPLFFGIICLILILTIVFFVLSVIGQVNLIKGTLAVEAGAESLSFRELFNDSRPYLARAFGLNLLVFLAGFAVIIIIFVVAFGVTIVTFGFGLLCLIPLICLLIPISLYIRIVIQQSNIAIVAEDLGVMDALQRGWNIARENLGSMIIMGLILILGAAIINFIIAIPIIIVLFPIFTGLVLSGDASLQGGLLIAGICFVIYLPVLILLNGILQAYVTSAWTLTFLRLTGNSPDGADEPLPAAA